MKHICYFRTELEKGRAFRVGFGFGPGWGLSSKIFGLISGPYAKFFYSRLIKSKDLFQLSNRFFFVARKNIIVYDGTFNHSG